ncbi:MAG: bifunctional glutamate N-acetyltransferase/amino-acid acetyltransferase ArgJ [Gammaproteobacteria bacterium]|nr:bifunctional glutamate N-acetyltransferase/amino-acid acetyltransferase ArgJ [Gammaproteobacteria bacterium]
MAAVGLSGLPEMWPVPGVRLGVARAGIKKPDRRDLVVVALDARSVTAGVFTLNAFCAAPVTLARRHLSEASPRYFLINTGYANAGTGNAGLEDASQCCEGLARLAGCTPNAILPFSTGVIGERLPVAKVLAGLPQALADLRANGWVDAAHGIMTTDTVPKGASVRVPIGDRTVTVTGLAKGSGMIQPNMATMLAFVATDASVTQPVLQSLLKDTVDRSFNCVTVDGDTSTNDACMLVATGAAGAPMIDTTEGPDYAALRAAVYQVCLTLAQAVVRDGEGATKFITVQVEGGRSVEECRAVAYTVAHSPLVKTAFFASDPNWGRILAAVGRAGITDLDVERVNIDLNAVRIVSGGGRDARYTEELGQAAMRAAEITICIQLQRGNASAQVWTCDFSYDYVRINAEYRS